MAELLDITASWLDLGDDPLLVYSLAAAALLAFVSLFSGLGRLDLMVLLRPLALLRLCGAVLASFLLVVAAEYVPGVGTTGQGVLLGAARFPLYLLALAYGPTVGLAAGALFAAATAAGPLPGWNEAALGLELLVLGWLAIYPSPRLARWAGPLNALLAHLFTAGTAGVALHAWRDGGATLGALLAGERAVLPGLVVAWLLLALVGPGRYRRLFPYSRIAPRGAGGERAELVRRDRRGADAAAAAGSDPGLLAAFTPLRRRRRRPRRLDSPTLPLDDPNA